MSNVTLQNITEIVINSISEKTPSRNRQLISSLLHHAHDFCKENKVTHQEFIAACEWLRRAGEISNEKRNEFILIGDILGIEVLVDMLDHAVTEGESESTVLGPFFRENAPEMPKGASIIQAPHDGAATIRVRGTVRDVNNQPLPGVTIDVWEDAPNGLYEQQDEAQPEYNLRGKFTTDDKGEYEFVGFRAVPYPIPYDGAGGELLNYMGHHPWRPGHIHFKLEKPGYQSLVSQIFDPDSDYLEKDSVFAVKASLIGKIEKAPSAADTDYEMQFDFKLKQAASKSTAYAG